MQALPIARVGATPLVEMWVTAVPGAELRAAAIASAIAALHRARPEVLLLEVVAAARVEQQPDPTVPAALQAWEGRVAAAAAEELAAVAAAEGKRSMNGRHL